MNDLNKMEQERLRTAADAVDMQSSANPDLGIPVDPDVAEFMGAFEDPAAQELEAEAFATDTLADLDDGLLTLS